MELSGAEIVVRCLQAEGVEYVFGYPGGAVLFIYDELFKQDKVKHILVRQGVLASRLQAGELAGVQIEPPVELLFDSVGDLLFVHR